MLVAGTKFAALDCLGQRMNHLLVIFLMMSFASAGMPADALLRRRQFDHRLATSGSFYVLSVTISFLFVQPVELGD